MTISKQNKQDFIAGYLEAALWSSTDTHPKTGDDVRLDDYEWGEGVEESLKDDCLDFIQGNKARLQAYCTKISYDPSKGTPWDSAGHDFWLTRNGHGAGFWDRGLGGLGDHLTEAAKVYGGVDLYLGDDELIYEV